MTKHRKPKTFAAVENLRLAQARLARYENALREIARYYPQDKYAGEDLVDVARHALDENYPAPDETEPPK